jgi:hypothetical protein
VAAWVWRQLIEATPSASPIGSPSDVLPSHKALRDIKASLERGHGVILAGNVYAEFLDPKVTTTGVLPELTDDQLRYLVSSHCLFVAGYIQFPGDDRGYVICKNSLGASWATAAMPTCRSAISANAGQCSRSGPRRCNPNGAG